MEGALAARALPGQTAMGDACQVFSQAAGLLVAVVDGLGHGQEAGQASEAALRAISENVDEDLERIFSLCHEALKKTRGVAMSLAQFDPQRATLRWAGVGNVEGLLLCHKASGEPGRERLLLKSGIVGYLLPALKPATLTVSPGDLLVMVTDGLRYDFAASVDRRAETQALADSILLNWSKANDDALVWVGRFLES